MKRLKAVSIAILSIIWQHVLNAIVDGAGVISETAIAIWENFTGYSGEAIKDGWAELRQIYQDAWVALKIDLREFGDRAKTLEGLGNDRT